MAFKDYSNPLYDLVENDDDWTSGLCCIFANVLRERYGVPMRAIIIHSPGNGHKTLVHAFGALPDGEMVDAKGVRTEAELLSEDYTDFTDRFWRELHGADRDEAIAVGIEDVTLGRLELLNPEDHEATNAAHDYIARNPDLFAALDERFGVASVPEFSGPGF
jgi:hypothetical protein